MADVTLTSGYPKQLSLGDLTGVLFRLTDIDDTETLDTGVDGSRIISVLVNWTGNPSTQASAGGHFTWVASTGVITFYPGEDNLGADVLVLCRGV